MNIFAFDLDLSKDVSPEVVVMRQSDHGGTTISATVYDHGTLFQTAATVTAYLCIRLPGSKQYYRKVATHNNGVGSVTAVVDEEYACSIPGRTDVAYFELHVGSSDIVSTASFTVIVLPSATAGMSAGQRYDDEIAATVRAWLNDHPEATTTVQDDSLTTAKLKNDAVTTAKLADGAVTSAKIADGTIATADLADGAVTSAKIADGTIVTADLADDSVTEAKLATNAVTSGKIADGAVATADLADSAVATAKLADGSVTTAKFASGVFAVLTASNIEALF